METVVTDIKRVHTLSVIRYALGLVTAPIKAKSGS